MTTLPPVRALLCRCEELAANLITPAPRPFKQMDPQMHSDYRPAAGADYQNGGIGAPQICVSGQFLGKTIRAELCELQKAELGRK